ncbi:hypothetical protein LJ737_02545 [Hymenobacter sp. 15J16-1T3B]|uniref:DUF7831 domain-containing protein n=1 Tax=Hymenobacter sp. 15J16-1T3B TaxID=2886941 RepID=UPI001D11F4B5|nr:hypothetical protein [Hymenobacter sp. 15J16-1T3B]MCC3156095.1 hypothetical protein [Hymenobacter sp. 15J16-1T3B]
MLRKQKFITPEDLKANPNTLYVFGDNERRRGYGGQAKAMRGELNAVGVRTKRKPARTASDDFWTDDTCEQNCQMIAEDSAPVFDHLRAGGHVVLPEDGLGTGLAELPTRAPRTFAYLQEQLHQLEACV